MADKTSALPKSKLFTNLFYKSHNAYTKCFVFFKSASFLSVTLLLYTKRGGVSILFSAHGQASAEVLKKATLQGYASKMDSYKEESFIFYIMKKGTPERSPQQALVFFRIFYEKSTAPATDLQLYKMQILYNKGKAFEKKYGFRFDYPMNLLQSVFSS